MVVIFVPATGNRRTKIFPQRRSGRLASLVKHKIKPGSNLIASADSFQYIPEMQKLADKTFFYMENMFLNSVANQNVKAFSKNVFDIMKKDTYLTAY